MVRRHGARRFFSTDQLNHRKKRHFYGLTPYSTVRCGAFLFFSRCGAVRIIFLKNTKVRCGAILVRGKFIRCGAVRLNRTAPHRTVSKNRPVKSLEINDTEVYIYFPLPMRSPCSYILVPGNRYTCDEHTQAAVRYAVAHEPRVPRHRVRV